MHSRLLILLIVSALGAAGCSHSPRYDSEGLYETYDDNGCYLVEIYDSVEDSCYLDCENLNDQQCDELSFHVYGELEDYIDDNFEGDNTTSDGETGDALIASYSVNAALSISPLLNTESENEATFQRIWRAVVAILPEKFLSKEIVEFHIHTDGVDNTLAYVTLHESIPNKWIIAIDSADFTHENDKDFIHTVIHEFAHIVFLNKSQVNPDVVDACTNYSITEGCSNPESYINAYYAQFWADIIADNPSALADVDPTDEDEITTFHGKYQEQFVSEYAATNPVEDAAEIFVHFVLGRKPQHTTKATDEKIVFLYQFPELVELRNKIRAKLRKHSDKDA